MAEKEEKPLSTKDLEEMIAAGSRATIKELMPALAALLGAQMQANANSGGLQLDRSAARDLGPRCSVCGQFAVACGGEPIFELDENGEPKKDPKTLKPIGALDARSKNPHVALRASAERFKVGSDGKLRDHCHRLAIVFPSTARHGKWFPGVALNGVCYRSNRNGHRIPVPAFFAIENYVEQWEENEEQLQTGREAEHHSGVLNGRTGDQRGFNQADRAWR